MEIKRVGSQPSAKGPDAWFSGTVRIDRLFGATEPARASGALEHRPGNKIQDDAPDLCFCIVFFRKPEATFRDDVLVTFEPGARTAWHTHPRGQTLIVTAGCGRVQRDGGPIEDIRPGDVVWFPPGEKHWHGAGATTAMSHMAIQEALKGSAVAWMEKVSDRQYAA